MANPDPAGETTDAALTETTRAGVIKQIEDGFPYLPAGCKIQLDRVAQGLILENLKQSVGGRFREDRNPHGAVHVPGLRGPHVARARAADRVRVATAARDAGGLLQGSQAGSGVDR